MKTTITVKTDSIQEIKEYVRSLRVCGFTIDALCYQGIARPVKGDLIDASEIAIEVDLSFIDRRSKNRFELLMNEPTSLYVNEPILCYVAEGNTPSWVIEAETPENMVFPGIE